VNPYASVVRALGRTRAFSWVGARALHRLDLPFRDRRHSVTSLGTDFPLCYLTVRGRLSGVERTVPLLYVEDGDRVVLIASNWGRPDHPAWALNLDAASSATVTVDGVSRVLRPRRARADEFERYWRAALAFWPGYEGYRHRAGREIRMYVLEPGEPTDGQGSR
jgi:deazaflavin-dependent oxidoreductase (nitroreductase family)